MSNVKYVYFKIDTLEKNAHTMSEKRSLDDVNEPHKKIKIEEVPLQKQIKTVDIFKLIADYTLYFDNEQVSYCILCVLLVDKIWYKYFTDYLKINRVKRPSTNNCMKQICELQSPSKLLYFHCLFDQEEIEEIKGSGWANLIRDWVKILQKKNDYESFYILCCELNLFRCFKWRKFVGFCAWDVFGKSLEFARIEIAIGGVCTMFTLNYAIVNRFKDPSYLHYLNWIGFTREDYNKVMLTDLYQICPRGHFYNVIKFWDESSMKKLIEYNKSNDSQNIKFLEDIQRLHFRMNEKDGTPLLHGETHLIYPNQKYF